MKAKIRKLLRLSKPMRPFICPIDYKIGRVGANTMGTLMGLTGLFNLIKKRAKEFGKQKLGKELCHPLSTSSV